MLDTHQYLDLEPMNTEWFRRSGTHNLLNYPSMTIRQDCKVVWASPVLWIKPA